MKMERAFMIFGSQLIPSLSLTSFVPQTGVRHSTFESICLARSSQSIASGFLRFWDILNFKKDMEFVGITVLFLDEKTIRQSPSDCEHKPRTPRCGWTNPFCPELGPHQRNNSSCYPSPH
ncbi:hypothetical protein F2Q70_00007928 [Brassica cretica]|uniref:Uncharacterized protein n=1 Tax=Brassica cretica TaxID=69181 RepID=A0A8S9M4F4_BRACR|nr:hypothetical protein F2Q70_00007928 [Brassica cretica]